MKRIIAILMILSLILVAGCSQESTEAPAEVEEETGPSSVSVVEQEPTTTETEEETVVVETPTEDVDPVLQKLIDKAMTVKSLSYDYNEFKTGTTGYAATVLLKGDLMRQRFPKRSGVYKGGDKFDTVYFNLKTGSVEAYCETADICDASEMGQKVDVSGEDFITETPFDVLEDAKKGKVIRNEMLFNKDTKVVEETLANGNKKLTWIETWKGMPLKYEITSPDKQEKIRSVSFENLLQNSVDDSDLTP